MKTKQNGHRLHGAALVYVLVAFCVLVLLVAAFLVGGWARDDGLPDTGKPTVKFYRLTQALSRGDRFDPDHHVEAFEVPADVAEGARYLSPLKEGDLEPKRGRRIEREVPKGAVLCLQVFLADEAGLRRARIADGYRMVTIKVRSGEVSKSLAPEASIDISARFPTPEGTVQSMLILEGVDVLEVGPGEQPGANPGLPDEMATQSIGIVLPVEDALALSNVDNVCSPFGPYQVMVRKDGDRTRLIEFGALVGRINPKVREIVENQLKVKLYE